MYQPLELQDGTLLWFGVARSPHQLGLENGIYYEDNRLPGEMNFCLRSLDDGQSWSDPINTDGPNPSPQWWTYAKDEHVSEISAGETNEGRVLVLTRPIRSPWMWETWSDDAGQSWTPWARGAFPMWACSQIVRTASGVLLIGGRHPGLAIEASYDNGMTWQCYRIDTTSWANGVLYEVEPDLVMYASTAHYADPRVRAHLFRVTPEGLEPVRVRPPTQ